MSRNLFADLITLMIFFLQLAFHQDATVLKACMLNNTLMLFTSIMFQSHNNGYKYRSLKGWWKGWLSEKSAVITKEFNTEAQKSCTNNIGLNELLDVLDWINSGKLRTPLDKLGLANLASYFLKGSVNVPVSDVIVC